MMRALDIYSDYDHFAWFYNKYWGGEYSRPALAVYNILLFPHLPDGCRILDLCCGAGQIAYGLAERGYRVTGLDGSEAMLEFARANAPGVEFIRADARDFHLTDKFHGVISAFDSLNHIMKLEELKMVFSNIYETMEDGGLFLFDLNLEDESEMLGNSLEMVEDDHVCVVRASYKPEEKLKRYDVTMFRLEEASWRRSDLTLFQRYYAPDDVILALAQCGFSRVKTYDARREFGFTISDGRMFYLTRK
ncbi:MAG TPA: methyltransferase domain-containing protein [Blastocatellia bacterium]|jgi:SAM-dependent methyltransferase|nr:methyltransferase domain-containing protein [Blastocatellia bacterium]